jgi:hypothetical protein
VFGVQPSILLHPLDFLGADDTDRLSFFPAMKQPSAAKLKLAGELFDMLTATFDCVPMGEHATAIRARKAVTPPAPVGSP